MLQGRWVQGIHHIITSTLWCLDIVRHGYENMEAIMSPLPRTLHQEWIIFLFKRDLSSLKPPFRFANTFRYKTPKSWTLLITKGAGSL